MIDPMEAIIAAALDGAGIRYTCGAEPTRLDFQLPNGVEIEVKQMHSPRIAEQMSRTDNVIAIQGRRAVEWFASLLTRSNHP